MRLVTIKNSGVSFAPIKVEFDNEDYLIFPDVPTAKKFLSAYRIHEEDIKVTEAANLEDRYQGQFDGTR